MKGGTLFVAPCGWAEARAAVRHWHYSRRMPRSRGERYGVWEGGRFVGCVIFGDSASKDLLRPYGLGQEEGCELQRVALGEHLTPTSRVLAVAVRLLGRARPALRLVVAFADPGRGHHGGLYQACGWVYAGLTRPAEEYVVGGRRYHGRALRNNWRTCPRGHAGAANVAEWARLARGAVVERVVTAGKHRYLLPLDGEMRARVAALARPYPKRDGGAESGPAPAHGAGGGAIPTPSLFQGHLFAGRPHE
jgi:hypothetical protein